MIVSTDIQGPRGVAFAKWQDEPGSTDLTPQELDVLSTTGQATNDAEEDPNDALQIVADTTLTGAANANLMFAHSAVDGTLNYAINDADTMGVDEALHDGTYNGAEGTYRCTGDVVCTVTFNDKGMVTGNTGGWVFIPDEGATSDQPDYDYLHYGFWLMRTTDEDGVLEYDEVETFAGSSLVPTGSVETVRGSATYEGGARGVYVHSVSNSDGTEASATSGHFSAEAELTATFGQVHEGTDPSDTNEPGTIAQSLLNTVTGTIDSFELSGGEANTWSVALEGDIDATNGTVSDGTAKGGMGDGSLSATFHGSVAAAADGSIPVPGSVVGEFNAGFSNGSVAGAFGARN